MSLTKPPDAPQPEVKASMDYMEQDGWYARIRDDPPSPPPPRGVFDPDKLPATLAASAAAAFAAAAGVPSVKKPAPRSAAAKPKPKAVAGAARVKPATEMGKRKLAAIFQPGGAKPPPAPPPGKAGTGAHWDRKEGRAYLLDKNGKRTPCDI